MNLDEERLDRNFERVKADAEAWYDSVEEVHCPYLNQTVAFNKKGITHIKFKKDGVARSRQDQYMRLKHIRQAYRILEKSRTLQEYKEGRVFEEMKSNKKRESVLQDAKYFGFVAVIPDKGFMKRLKIIVKQVGGGKPYFWSIIPFWNSNKELKLHSGDMEAD